MALSRPSYEAFTKIRAGFNLTFESEAPAPLLLTVNLRPEREADLLTPQTLTTTPDLPLRQYFDSFANVCTPTVVPRGHTTISADFLIRALLHRLA